MFRKRQIIGTMYIMMTVIVAGIIAACTPCVVREAQTVVAEADSLRAEGQMYDDSVQLAEACATLGRWQWFYADDYAHACYHYGRLLREKGDPVTAMQVLIRAIHSRTHDYHILGRVYSNMGSICHLANDYSLSYDMYQRSADMFLSNGDSLLYYFGLNNMAFEKAMLADKQECLALLHIIGVSCMDRHVACKATETQAELYKITGQYDSTIYCANGLIDSGYTVPSVILIKAQAYDDLGISDSAIVYANMVLSNPYAAQQDKFNAIYIVLHNDSTLSADTINALASQREDIRYYDYEPKKNKYTQATQLLDQALSHTYNFAWLYAIIATLIFVCGAIAIYAYGKQRKHQLLSQKIHDLTHKTIIIREKHNKLAERYDNQRQQIKNEISHKCALLKDCSDLRTELKWKDFEAMCRIIDSHFYMLASKLRQKQCLNETELRLCVLVLLDMSRTEIADTLPYALSSVGKLKDQTAKLLGTTGKNLREYLINLAIEG